MALEFKPVEERVQAESELRTAEIEAQYSWTRPGLLALGVAVLLTAVYSSPLRGYLSHLGELSQQIQGLGALAPLVLTLGVAVLVAIGLPRLLFCFLAGMALGFWSGLLWAQLGTLAGNYILFVSARAGAGDWLMRFVRKRARFHDIIQRRGVAGVILARQLPLPGAVINLACALLPIGQWDFLLGTLIGQLPQAIPCTLIGAGVLQGSLARRYGLIGLAVIASILGWFVLRRLVRRSGQFSA